VGGMALLNNLDCISNFDIVHVPPHSVSSTSPASPCVSQFPKTAFTGPARSKYIAPEVIMACDGAQYGPAVDMWSAGVMLFTLLGEFRG